MNWKTSYATRETWLCLDFANTLKWRGRGPAEEHLGTYADLVAWGRKIGLMTDEASAKRKARADRQPHDAAAVHSKAIALRERIYRIFSPIAAGDVPAQADIDQLNADITEAAPHLRVASADGAFAWNWADPAESLESLLWPIVLSAAQLLTSDDLGRVGECEEPICGYLFFDASKNHSRRWCRMDLCGNRAKFRRYYRRQQAVG